MKWHLSLYVPNFMRKFSHVFWDLLYVFHWPLASADLSQQMSPSKHLDFFSLLVDLLLRSFEREKEWLWFESLHASDTNLFSQPISSSYLASRGQWPFEIENRSSRHTVWRAPAKNGVSSANLDLSRYFCLLHLSQTPSLFHLQFSINFGRGPLSGRAKTWLVPM